MRDGPTAAATATANTSPNAANHNAASNSAPDDLQVVAGSPHESEQAKTRADGDSGTKASSDQEFIFIHDTGFTVRIVPPGVESFEIQVREARAHHLCPRVS